MFQRNETESEATPNQPLGEAFGQHQFRAATVEHGSVIPWKQQSNDQNLWMALGGVT